MLLRTVLERTAGFAQKHAQKFESDALQVRCCDVVFGRFSSFEVSEGHVFWTFSRADGAAAAFGCSNSFVLSWVETFLGGAAPKETSSVLTDLNVHLTTPLVKAFLDGLNDAFSPLFSSRWSLGEASVSANALAQSGSVARVSFSVGSFATPCTLWIPYEAVSPIQEALSDLKTLSMFYNEKESWTDHWKEAIHATPMPLQACLEGMPVLLKNFQPGAFVPFLEDDAVHLRFKNQRFAQGRMGQEAGRLAVAVEKTVFCKEESDGLVV